MYQVDEKGREIFMERFCIYIGQKMIEHADLSYKMISYPKAKYIISRFILAKELKQLRQILLNEMFELKILERINKNNIKILL